MNNPMIQSNLEVFNREIELDLEPSDHLPVILAEQDLRSKNRFREHSGEGHRLTDLQKRSQLQPNHSLFMCACQWVGWLIPKGD